MQNLERLKQIIICPKCKTSIKNKEIKCSKCSKIYLSKNKLYFLKINTTFKVSDWFDKIKSMVKKYPVLYKFIIRFISPVSSNPNSKVKKWLRLFKKNSIIVDVGSGTNRFRKDIINLDAFD